YILMAKSGVFDSYDIGLSLPCDKDTFVCDFLGAGLSIRGNKKYYAVIGISNGGVVKIFDKMKRKKIFDDCGYVGQLENGTFLTTQIRQKYNLDKCTSESLVFDASFYEMIRTLPTPAKFIILRILNVTLMRNVWFGNFIKSFLVKMLVSKRKKAPVMIMRSFSFLDDRVEIIDQIICQKKIDFKWLEAGRRFVAIHMASSRYFSDSDAESYVGGRAVLSVDVRKLSKDFVVEVSRNIQCW
ncbi:MAG: hypothetical protein OEV64_11100, partial [Desulfobulbaceae bacterium]|nr:hypothetical protein [Desulfobulbaceae bacterium]